jgi:diacylglycerol kinase
MKQPHLVQSFRHACDGLAYVVRTQRNARIHVVIGAIVVAVGLWLRLDLLRWSILALTIGAVWVGETLNTAVEAVVDLLSPEYHDRAKVAKDVAAGAVLLLGLMAIVVGVLILGPPLWERLMALATS